MAFRGQMDDGGDLALSQQLLDQCRIANIADHQLRVLDSRYGFISRIGQAIEHDDGIAGMRLRPVVDEIAPYEPSAARD